MTGVQTCALPISGSLVMGSPAKVVRALTADEQAALPGWAEEYVKVAAHHRRFD